MKLALTSKGMMRSTKSTGICLVLVFLAVTMKDKQTWQGKRRKKARKACIVQKAHCLGWPVINSVGRSSHPQTRCHLKSQGIPFPSPSPVCRALWKQLVLLSLTQQQLWPRSSCFTCNHSHFQGMENDPLERPGLQSIGVRRLSFHLSQERGAFSEFWREQSMATKLGFNEIQFGHLEGIQDGKDDYQDITWTSKGLFLPLRRQLL